MVTVNKDGGDSGISLVEFEKEFYVADVVEGPFYGTSIDKGDKILSINGKKSKDISSLAYAEELLEFKEKITLFVMRPDLKDRGYNWVIRNTWAR